MVSVQRKEEGSAAPCRERWTELSGFLGLIYWRPLLAGLHIAGVWLPQGGSHSLLHAFGHLPPLPTELKKPRSFFSVYDKGSKSVVRYRGAEGRAGGATVPWSQDLCAQPGGFPSSFT